MYFEINLIIMYFTTQQRWTLRYISSGYFWYKLLHNPLSSDILVSIMKAESNTFSFHLFSVISCYFLCFLTLNNLLLSANFFVAVSHHALLSEFYVYSWAIAQTGVSTENVLFIYHEHSCICWISYSHQKDASNL